jgi:hypothetical protein
VSRQPATGLDNRTLGSLDFQSTAQLAKIDVAATMPQSLSQQLVVMHDRAALE